MDWRKQVGIVDSFPSYHARSLTAFSPTMDNVRMGENDHFLREVCTGMFRPQAFQQLGLLASALCPRGASMSGCRANLPATPPPGSRESRAAHQPASVGAPSTGGAEGRSPQSQLATSPCKPSKWGPTAWCPISGSMVPGAASGTNSPSILFLARYCQYSVEEVKGKHYLSSC